MLANSQPSEDFKQLNYLVKRMARELLGSVPLTARHIELRPSVAARFEPLPVDTVAIVDRGQVSVLDGATVVSTLDAGDIIFPDTDLLPDGVEPLRYGSEAGAHITAYSRQHLLEHIRGSVEASLQWAKLTSLQGSLQHRHHAMQTRETVSAGGDPEVFPPGAVLIKQGDLAEDIFSMTEGEAEVLVNDMRVAQILSGEMFGTMAALTGGYRNATVRAVKTCTVVRVPKERFFDLIRWRPAAIEGLLVDMAKSISELNEEVVTLRRKHLEN